jgi:hypothetical protein
MSAIYNKYRQCESMFQTVGCTVTPDQAGGCTVTPDQAGGFYQSGGYRASNGKNYLVAIKGVNNDNPIDPMVGKPFSQIQIAIIENAIKGENHWTVPDNSLEFLKIYKIYNEWAPQKLTFEALNDKNLFLYAQVNKQTKVKRIVAVYDKDNIASIKGDPNSIIHNIKQILNQQDWEVKIPKVLNDDDIVSVRYGDIKALGIKFTPKFDADMSKVSLEKY